MRCAGATGLGAGAAFVGIVKSSDISISNDGDIMRAVVNVAALVY